MREWLTVKEAAIILKRDESRIRRLIYQERLTASENSDGITVVRTREVLEIEPLLRSRRNNKTRRQIS